MKERPILFSGPMVCAILAGSKTQTRRIVKPQPSAPRSIYTLEGADTVVTPHLSLAHKQGEESRSIVGWHWKMTKPSEIEDGFLFETFCPYGQPGDRLWVKETHRTFTEQGITPAECSASGEEEYWSQDYVAYQATPRRGLRIQPDHTPVTFLDESTPLDRNQNLIGPWKPSIFCRREYSRITLEIVSVRVERLQEISEEDAIAEGVAEIPGETGMLRFRSYLTESPSRPLTAYESYRSLWESINGPGSWDTNPWVWVVTFNRLKP